MLKKLALASALILSSASVVSAQTAVQWGFQTGSNPRNLQIRDLSAAGTFITVGTVDSVAHTAVINSIGPGVIGPTQLAAGAAATNIGTLGGALSGSTLPNPAIAAGYVNSSMLASSLALVTPTATTPANGDSSTAVATTAFTSNASNILTGHLALNLGTQSVVSPGVNVTLTSTNPTAGITPGIIVTGTKSQTNDNTSLTGIVSAVTDSLGWSGSPVIAVTSSATISGTVLTVIDAPTGGTFQVLQMITGSGVSAGTIITSLGTGTGGIGTYNLNKSSTVSTPVAITGTGNEAFAEGGRFECYAGMTAINVACNGVVASAGTSAGQTGHINNGLEAEIFNGETNAPLPPFFTFNKFYSSVLLSSSGAFMPDAGIATNPFNKSKYQAGILITPGTTSYCGLCDFDGAADFGIDLGTVAFAQAAILVPNNSVIEAQQNDNSRQIHMLFMDASNFLHVGDSSFSGSIIDMDGYVILGSLLQYHKYTIAQLLAIPCAGNEAQTAWVSDTVGTSSASTWHGIVAGGGSTTVHSEASCDGTNWVYN